MKKTRVVGIVPSAGDITRLAASIAGEAAPIPEENVREIQRAAKAVAEPSRAQELREELASATTEDLLEQLSRTRNKAKRKRIKKMLKRRQTTPPELVRPR